MTFHEFMQIQCSGCHYESNHDPEHCKDCCMRFRAAWEGGYANCKQEKHKQRV